MNGRFQKPVNWNSLLSAIRGGDQRVLARAISWIENETSGYRELLEGLENPGGSQVVGITGPPGAGKSSLVDLLIGQWVAAGKKIAVLCVDPSSPFHYGALLGDRIRMSEWYNHPDVFIRSMASRGSLGGLNPQIIEVTDIIRAASFDRILIETVGVGQNEIGIAGLADVTVVVLVPETGDDVQTMKSGLSEIADIFVVNKFDRPGADRFYRFLESMNSFHNEEAKKQPIIVKTIATEKKGVEELSAKIQAHLESGKDSAKKSLLLAERAYQLIVYEKMRHVDKKKLAEKIRHQMDDPHFNLYRFIASY